MAKREFSMLAHKYETQDVRGWFASEKLDGMRFNWDGGRTRGMIKADVPWANCAKDGRYVNKQYATGLWSRYGNVIHAPDWFLDALPKIPLDGEMYTRAVNRQSIFSTIKDLTPGPEWKLVQAHVFDMIPLDFWLMDGVIKNTNFTKTLKGCYRWAVDSGYRWDYLPVPMTQFVTTVELLKQKVVENDVVKVHPQRRLSRDDTRNQINQWSGEIVAAGGEGLILKDPACYWQGERTHRMLKFKPTDDMEGTVVGYITGRETDLGSKLLGMMGALVLRLDNGKEMELSGFTDDERMLGVTKNAHFNEGRPDQDARDWAMQHPEGRCPDWIEAMCFPRGAKVNFKYRGLSSYGVPQEARYNRLRLED